MKYNIQELTTESGDFLTDQFGNITLYCISDGQVIASIVYPNVEGARDIAIKRLEKQAAINIEILDKKAKEKEENQTSLKEQQELFVKDFFSKE